MTIYPQPKPVPTPKSKTDPRRPVVDGDPALDRWKAEVKKRAGYRCEIQDQHHRCAGLLHAHHILARDAHPKLTLDLDNGVALCAVAHDSVHCVRWFRVLFKRWLDATYPGRRERLQQKAIA